MVFTCNWGILATGGIAEQFSRDLLIDTATRNVNDVTHRIAAIASSTSFERASAFAKKIKAGPDVKCYGSYEELVADERVDIIYVATPHAMHYENCKLVLSAGKPILCEKPFTINAGQTAHLIEIARSKQLFMMEAVWTRFFPLAIELQRLLFEERIIGDVKKVITDFGLPFDIQNMEITNRILDPKLGGGALLDIGIYCLTWVFMTCFADPRNERTRPIVSSGMLKTPITGVDEFTNISLVFPKSHVSATVATNLTVKSDEEAVCRIQGTKGDITVQWPPYRPTSFTIYRKETQRLEVAQTREGPVDGEIKTFEIPGGGHGMFWEADECARCLRDGKKESFRIPLDESLLTMTVMDAVRQQNDFYYPQEIEKFER